MNFIPMLLDEKKEPFNSSEYLFELKFDGTRTLIFVEPSKIKIVNKRGNILNETYPELQSIKKLVNSKCIFDGEIVLMIDGKPSFKKLQERALLKDKFKISLIKKEFPVTFVCYDIIYEGKDLTELPLSQRKNILLKYPDTDFFVKTKFILTYGEEFYKAIRKENLEGIVAKKLDSTYKINKRSKDWIKIKNLKEEEFYIIGYNEGKGVLASILLGKTSKNKIVYVSNVTIGKNSPDFRLIKDLKKCKNIYDAPDEDYIFVEPNLKCIVAFMEKTKTDKLRQPIYKGVII